MYLKSFFNYNFKTICISKFCLSDTWILFKKKVNLNEFGHIERNLDLNYNCDECKKIAY